MRGNDPQSFAEVMQMFRDNKAQKAKAFGMWEASIEEAAKCDAEYARAYAKAIVAAEGTAAVREATARAATADERARRDVSRDMVAVWKEKARALEGERANINGMGDWLKRLEPGLGG
jgi:hypothetical protein